MKKILQPIHHKDAYTALIKKEIDAWMRDVIFLPLVNLLEDHGIQREKINEVGIAVEHALSTGQIHYADGQFTGAFNAEISRELQQLGAEWQKTTKSWKLPLDKIPYALRGAIAANTVISRRAHESIAKTLTIMEANIAAANLGLDLGRAMDTILKDLQKQYLRTVTGIETVGVKQEISAAQRAMLDTTLTDNLDLSIKNFAAELIPDLRQQVEKNLLNGGRTDRLAELIQSRYNVSRRKAEFLADQETGMLTAKFAQIQAEEIGSTEYVWSTSRDERVRPDHQDLDGRRFSYSSPPITNRATGARNNPGEDFRCLPDSQIEFVGGIKKAFRRWYSGELTLVVLESGKSLRATPNHPVLTINGWKPIGALNQTDKLVELCDECLLSFKPEGQQGVTSLRKIFETLGKTSFGQTFPGKREQFHGDGTDRHIDIIWATRPLILDRQSYSSQCLKKLALAKTSLFALCKRGFRHLSNALFPAHRFCPAMAGLGESLPFLETHPIHAEPICLGTATDRHAGLDQTTPNDDTLQTCALRNGKFTLTGHVGFDDRFWIKLQTIMRVRPVGIHEIKTEGFDGNIYNLETETGYYTTANVIVSNCRCVAKPIVVFPS